MAGASRPGARAVSNGVHAQDDARHNRLRRSDYLWQWGQFLDHDLDLTDGVDPAEQTPIPVPAGDRFFDPDGTGNVVIAFNRSLYHQGSTPRQQVNEITAWIDASHVYGSDSERATALRTLDGTGALRTSAGDLLPFNDDGLPNAGGSGAQLFLGGDVRANEQVGLTAMHTLFVREHNRIAARIGEHAPELDGEAIYQRARRQVIALMQAITYNEFLPALLGEGACRRTAATSARARLVRLPDGRRPRGGPPQEALDACASKTEGDVVAQHRCPRNYRRAVQPEPQKRCRAPLCSVGRRR